MKILAASSTLVRLVVRHEPPEAGRSAIDGQRVAGPDWSRLLVFQDRRLDHRRNVRGNVMLGLAARGVARSERVVGILGQPI